MNDDTISRAAAVKALEETKQSDPFNRYEYQNIGIDWSIDAIKALPPAQPVEDARAMCGECDAWNQYKNPQTGWIPTSVKPPEPFKLVLIQDSCGCYELNTYIPPRINPKQYSNGYWGEVGTVYFDYFDVEAWCPLPAPYRPEGEEHERFDRQTGGDCRV